MIRASNPAYTPAKQLLARLTASEIQVKQAIDRDAEDSAVAFMLVTSSDLSEVVELTHSFVEIHHLAKCLIWVAPICPEHSDLGKKLAAAEAIVTSCQQKTLIVRHAPLIDELLRNNKEIKNRRTLSLPLGNDALPWLCSQDLVDGICNWLQDENSNSQRIVLSGSKLTGADLAREISQALKSNLDSRKFAMSRFEAIDVDKSGEIDTEEMFPYLLKLGYGREEAQTIIDEADTNKDGSIDFEEFIEGLSEHLEKILADVPYEVQYIDVPRATALYDLTAKGMAETAARSWLDLLSSLQQFDLSVVDSSQWLGKDSITLGNWLEQHVLDFINVYILSGRGVLTTSEGILEGKPALTTKLLQSGDRLLQGIRTLDNKAVEWQIVGEASGEVEEVRHELPKGGERILKLKNSRLISMSVRGLWTGRRWATELLFKHQPLPRWQINLFRELGELQIEETSSLIEPEGIVCNCTQITCGKLQEAIEGGMDTLEQIAEETKVTMICGGCQPLVEELLGSANLAVAELVSKQDLGRGIFSFQFRSVSEATTVSKPGQHILIQGRVDGIWVTRAYSLSSAADKTQAYEITVKREEMGLFSRWLCDRADAHSLFRISQPRGDYFLTDEQPVYFFAGGIGVTPAIAMMRTLAAQRDNRRFHLDWSAPNAEDFILKQKLENLTAEHPNLSVKLRPTRTEGRLSVEEVQHSYKYSGGAVAFLCGPSAYMDAVRSHLVEAGWQDDAIRQELFSSKLDEEGKAQDRLPQRSVVQLAGGVTPIETHSFEIQPVNSLAEEAEVFLKQCYLERGLPEVFLPRWQEVNQSIETTGTYEHTLDELTFGARLAWRNSSRCVGRYFWQSLLVRDLRHLETEEQMFEAIVEHIKIGTNNGDIRAVMTVFKPDGRRLWNSQLLRYAAYKQPDGTILGDPANLEFTEQAFKLGWTKENRTAFDYLPIVIQLPGKEPRLFELPSEIILDVPLSHPRYQWFKNLGLKWYALPAVCNMSLDLGGIQYTCMPFNGFYMGTEIGGRNFSDAYRYNMLPTIAEKMGLDCSSNDTLWKDFAIAELNLAVVHSFKKHGVRLIDHHTMTDYFMQFMADEQRSLRPVHADWGWIVPPVSGSTTPVYPVEMNNRILKPNYFYLSEPWKTNVENSNGSCPFHKQTIN
ncbi:nitric oxide synthase oxygenase [Myxosarcina sp. GI1(2024)]